MWIYYYFGYELHKRPELHYELIRVSDHVFIGQLHYSVVISVDKAGAREGKVLKTIVDHLYSEIIRNCGPIPRYFFYSVSMVMLLYFQILFGKKSWNLHSFHLNQTYKYFHWQRSMRIWTKKWWPSEVCPVYRHWIAVGNRRYIVEELE